MKTKLFSKNIFFISFLMTAVLWISACEKDDDNDAENSSYMISGSASGSQENPPTASTGSGAISGTYNSENNKLDYTISWTDISGPATQVHFHAPADIGANADPITTLTITANGISGQSTGSVTLSETEEDYLLDGKVYFNVHSALYPDGEIRGQLITAVQ